MNLLVSALFMLLHIAIILLIAYVLLWVIRDWFGVSLDPMVMKFAQIVVALLCLIVVVLWLSGALGYSSYRLPFG
jgi:hypothetical protein